MTRPLVLALVLALAPPCVRSQPESCFSRQHANAAVNARVALAATAGVTAAARSAKSEQECVLACCSQRVQAGAKCNVAVFNGNKHGGGGGEDNCFLYHCPNERDCPLTQAPPGVRTFDIFKGVIHPSTVRPAATSIASAPALTIAAGRDVFVTVAAAKSADKAATKQKKAKSDKKPKSQVAAAAPKTAASAPLSTPPPPSTPRPPTSAASAPPPSATTPAPVTTTPAAATSKPQSPTTTTTTPPPSSTTLPPTPSPSAAPVTPSPPTSTSPPLLTTPSSRLTTATPITPGSGRSQASKVPAGSQESGGKMSSGAPRSGVVAFLVAGAVALMLALAVALGGRKAVESFDRRHYTRLELTDLHYDL
ncbi:MANSC domain-containing protein 1 [Syngnathus acus]|uniref:MANSC domain-containing protein 1 n=1 Tax=Syngnathus acus TaxID=161584 RepID=UPI001885EF3A|nr:MANSC domain-containing protein 1 [Syngnathus acus]XP_037098792.1 MANSC domain-containing protein 1 [Syngnathus acus]XP_037098793.1 MANSC domain-containing protein 1 [Syngnathus acus]XP_037098794.1 MANSC domain-containing protein 1 [Syngnathus acus]XP_037098795.1 MANSC domain-containing protein 1 [Syngnathus acus]